jgi:hypothetical protein
MDLAFEDKKTFLENRKENLLTIIYNESLELHAYLEAKEDHVNLIKSLKQVISQRKNSGVVSYNEIKKELREIESTNKRLEEISGLISSAKKSISAHSSDLNTVYYALGVIQHEQEETGQIIELDEYRRD